MSDQRFTTWRKARKSEGSGGCVEVCFDGVEAHGVVAVRDSKLGDDGQIFTFTTHEWECFLDGAAGGEFNLPG